MRLISHPVSAMSLGQTGGIDPLSGSGPRLWRARQTRQETPRAGHMYV